MRSDVLPIWVVFAGTILLILAAIETGHRVGEFARRRSPGKEDTTASVISGSILGLVAFMLAFTFGIVAGRFDSRKEMVRDEANAIRTTYLLADFLPEPARGEARVLLRNYTAERLAGTLTLQEGRADEAHMKQALEDAERTQRQLWAMAVELGRGDLNSAVGSLYIDSLNSVIEIHALRESIGLHARLPRGIWIVLATLSVFGMATIGYVGGVARSSRSLAQPVLAVSFSIVIVLIAVLDSPKGDLITVSQQPLIKALESMSEAPPGDTSVSTNTLKGRER